MIKVIKFMKAKFQQNSQTGFKLKKHYSIYNHTQAGATGDNNLRFLMIKSSNFCLLFTFRFRIASMAG